MNTLTIVLDTGPLGLVTNPNGSAEAAACAQWIWFIVAHGSQVYIPEIANYEIRRELIRANKTAGLSRLDKLIASTTVGYISLTTPMIYKAAELWAQLRNTGQATADPHALDGDVILAAQALTLGANTIVATTNVSHLSRLVVAREWRNIP